MSNRSLQEVRRRGAALVDLRDFRSGALQPAAPPPAPFAPSAPSVPKQVGASAERAVAKSAIGGLTPKGASQALRLLRLTGRLSPWAMAAWLGYELFEAWRMHEANLGPVPDLGPHWSVVRTCNYPTYTRRPYLVNRNSPICFEAFPSARDYPDTLLPGQVIPQFWQYLSYEAERPFTGSGYNPAAATLVQYARIAPGIGDKAVIAVPAYWVSPFEWNTPFATPRPFPFPALMPEAMPVAAPAPAPEPIPWEMIPQRLSSGLPHQSEWGYGWPDDVSEPLPAIEATPESKGEIAPEHTWAPALPGLKERKAKISTAARLALKLVNTVTEAVDFIDCFYDALDKECKRLPKHRGLRIMRAQHKLEALYANWDCVNLQQAVKNLIENEVEDRVIGAISKRIGKLSRESQRPVGYEAGPGAPGKVPKGTKTGPAPWKNWTDAVWKVK